MATTTYGGTADDYPYSHTKAVRMLSKTIDETSERGDGSLRQTAGRLGYKSAVVLSHMRTGRLPIPVDRAIELARATKMDEQEFLIAVLEQRFPDIDFVGIISGAKPSGPDLTTSDARLLNDLAETAGKPVSALPAEHIGVLREVVAEAHPRDRWISINEKNILDFFRKDLPTVARDGLTDEQKQLIIEAVA